MKTYAIITIGNVFKERLSTALECYKHFSEVMEEFAVNDCEDTSQLRRAINIALYGMELNAEIHELEHVLHSIIKDVDEADNSLNEIKRDCLKNAGFTEKYLNNPCVSVDGLLGKFGTFLHKEADAFCNMQERVTAIAKLIK